MAMALPGVECLTDFQLQVEHALDLRGRERVLFVDASSDATAPFTLCPIEAARDVSYSSHAVSPQSILQVYRDLEGEAPPPCWQLAIRGEAWTLGSAPGNAALHNLKAALRAFDDWLDMRA